MASRVGNRWKFTSVAGAVLFSICHFAAAEAANTKPEKFNFWELEDLTWWTEESTDEEIDEFLLAFSEGRPALTNMEWNIADRLIEDASTALPKLQYGFINTGTESALLTFSSIHASISNPESITINRELDLRILDANREGSRVLGIWTIPDSQFQVNFEKAVNLEIQRLNDTGSLAISIAEGTALHFLDQFTVKDFSQTPALLVQVGGNTRGADESLLQLSGPSSFKTLGTAFNLESSAVLVLKASSSFHVEAGKVFTGNGKVIADGADVYLKGDLSGFGGSYQQIGGALEIVSETQLNPANWNLSVVQLTSESKRLCLII